MAVAMGRPKKLIKSERKPTILSLKGTEDYRDWITRLADHSRLSLSQLVDHALMTYAREKGFEEPPNR